MSIKYNPYGWKIKPRKTESRKPTESFSKNEQKNKKNH